MRTAESTFRRRLDPAGGVCCPTANASLHSRTACVSWILPLLLLLLLALPAVVQAQFTYTINNGTITITGYDCSDSAVTVPSTISGLPVTRIGDYAFSYCGLTSVAIPNSVTRIRSWAFGDCTNLTSIFPAQAFSPLIPFAPVQDLVRFSRETGFSLNRQWNQAYLKRSGGAKISFQPPPPIRTAL